MVHGPVAPQPGYRAALRCREFRALWVAQLLSTLGDQVTRVALAALVLARSHSVALSALCFAVSFLPWLVGGPALGLLADRCPRRTVLVTCDVARGLLVGAMTLPGVPVWALLGLAAGAALLGPPFEAARGAVLPDVLPASLYPVAQSLSMASMQVAQVGGFALAGALVAVLPGTGALQVDCVSFLLSAVLLRLRLAHRPGADLGARAARGWWGESAKGLVVVARSPALRWLLAVTCVSCAASVVPEGLAVAQATALGAPRWAGGALAAEVPLGAALGALALTRFVHVDRQLALVGGLALLSTASTAAVLTRPGLLVTAVLWLVAGIGAAGSLPANVAFVLRLEPAVRGRALSVAQVCLQVSQGAALVLAGLLAAPLGAARAIGCTGLLGLLLVARLAVRRPLALGVTGPGAVPPVPVPVTVPVPVAVTEPLAPGLA